MSRNGVKPGLCSVAEQDPRVGGGRGAATHSSHSINKIQCARDLEVQQSSLDARAIAEDKGDRKTPRDRWQGYQAGGGGKMMDGCGDEEIVL